MRGGIKDSFDFVVEKSTEEADSGKLENNDVDEPIEAEEEGRYYLNLIKLQVNKAAVSSKQALLPFLRGRNFKKLSVICNHIPPWLEGEIKNLKMKMDIERKTQKEYEVVISNK